MAALELTNYRSGKLVALYATHKRDSRGNIIWKCQCDCGKQCEYPATAIKTHTYQSCGCQRSITISEKNKARGRYDSLVHQERLFRIWQGIYGRTHYSNHVSYKNYGGRGIQMCDAWENDYFVFKTWALSHGYSDDLTIERLDSNGNYEPDNCTWITKAEQAKNQRSNIRITHNGETHIASEWADIMRISHTCFYKRLQRHYTPEKLFKELYQQERR